MSKIEIAKLAAHAAVAWKVASLTRTVLARNTNVDPDGLPVQVGALVAGEVVAQQADPYTDRFVDYAFEKINEWKNGRNK